MEASIQTLNKNSELRYGVDSVTQLSDGLASFSNATVFGFVQSGTATLNGRHVAAGEYFSAAGDVCVVADGVCALFVKHEWSGRYCIGKVPTSGDVQYIDGCTDSLLVCPPRLGDACLNSLYFPPHTNQSFHTHDELRFGVVAYGHGTACCGGENIPLKQGDVFCIPAHEVHRFTTDGSPMVVIAYHPNSDWGPTDACHPMVNKTTICEPEFDN